ncbi:MAG: hypothetical protein AB1714_03425 [Acidobacteriota bacterium]
MAILVGKEMRLGWSHLLESLALDSRGAMGFHELFRVYEECQNAGWDGHGAAPVSEATYEQAREFLEALPLGAPGPSFGAEADGHITMEWYGGPRRTLSVSITPDGEIHYAALLGASKSFGSEPFLGESPAIVLDLIRRVTTK